MCLLQESFNTANAKKGTMSAISSACACISTNPIVKHLDIIRKVEFDVDVSLKSKWAPPKSRLVSSNHKKSQRSVKTESKKEKPAAAVEVEEEQQQPEEQEICENENRKTAMPEAPVSTSVCAMRRGWKKKKRRARKTNKTEDVLASCTDGVNGCPSRPNISTLSSSASGSSSGSDSTDGGGSKKVHFDEEHLVLVIEFPDDEESADMRKRHWEFLAVDRQRFKDRVKCVEDNIKSAFTPEHRLKVYTERFDPKSE